VEDGFVTAGHCGYLGHSIGDASNNALGTVVGSTWPLPGSKPDVGHVQTSAGWTPTAQVNGYNDGVIPVSAEWGGVLEYPVGATLCRYGQTSGGPICGTLNQTNVSVEYAAYSIWTIGASRVVGGCTSDGDSGGTWVGGVGQIQGTHIGGQPYANFDACPTTFEYLYFQPIRDALDEYSVTVLIAHGANAPDITDVECPDLANSYYGRFVCRLNGVDSQGEPQAQWSSNVGGSTNKTYFRKNCTPPSTISVTLQVTNPYGTDTEYYSFPCPTNPPY